jgi:hypothetical protein
MTGGAPVKQQEQTVFMYRLRIYTGLHSCVEVANVAVGFVMSKYLPVLFVWAVVPAALALVVTANFTGQLCCTPRSYWTRTGAMLNAVIMLIAACLSVYCVLFYAIVTGWCNATDGIYKVDHKDLCHGRPVRHDRYGLQNPYVPSHVPVLLLRLEGSQTHARQRRLRLRR